MNASDTGTAGWSVGKVLGLIVGIVAMVGFGVCGLCGLVIGVETPDLWGTVLPFALPGLLLAVLGFLLARKMVRLARRSEP